MIEVRIDEVELQEAILEHRGAKLIIERCTAAGIPREGGGTLMEYKDPFTYERVFKWSPTEATND